MTSKHLSKKHKAKKKLPQNEVVEWADIRTTHYWDCPHCGWDHEVDDNDERVVSCYSCKKKVRIG